MYIITVYGLSNKNCKAASWENCSLGLWTTITYDIFYDIPQEFIASDPSNLNLQVSERNGKTLTPSMRIIREAWKN